MKARFLITGVLTGYLVISSLFITKGVTAQGASLSIYPPVIEVDATPPSSPTTPMVIQNNNDQDVTVTIELIPFKANGINGNVQLDPELMNKGFYSYYRDRIQFLEGGLKTNQVHLAALESKEVTLNVNISRGDPPGDYYYSVVFKTVGNAPEETSFSQIPMGIASNLLLSVGPKGQSSGGITEFKTSQFKSKGPVEFTLKLHNASKHLIRPEGVVEIRNMFGQKVGSVDVLPQYILAGSDRYLTDLQQASQSAQMNPSLRQQPQTTWQETFLLGLYKATAKIDLDEGGNTLEAHTYFFAFPLYFFFPLALVLFITLSIYLKVKRKL